MSEKIFLKTFFQGLSATQLSDPQEIVNAFKQAEQAELVGVREVRARNSEANSKEEATARLDCELCRFTMILHVKGKDGNIFSGRNLPREQCPYRACRVSVRSQAA